MSPADAIDKTKTAAVLLPGDAERISVIGGSQTIKLDGQMTNGLFAMITRKARECRDMCIRGRMKPFVFARAKCCSAWVRSKSLRPPARPYICPGEFRTAFA